MREIIEVLKDNDKSQAIVDRAFSEVAKNPENSFSALVKKFDSALNQKFEELGRILVNNKYTDHDYATVTKKDLRWRSKKLKQKLFYTTYQLLLQKIFGRLDDEKHWRLKLILMKYLRPVYRFFKKAVSLMS